MKLNLLERTVTCCLVGAATLAIASGWKRADPPEGDGVSFIGAAAFEKSADLEADEPARGPDLARVVEVRLDGRDDTAEQELDKLVKAFEKASGADKEVKRNALREALTKVFRERTEAQRTRIAEMKERLNAIETQLERRSNLEEQIVQRRLGELLGDKDELSWDHEPALEVLEFAERRGESREPIEHAMEFLMEYPKEFPKEFPSFRESPASARQELSRERAEQQRAMQLAEERAAVAVKRAREAQTLAAKAQERKAQDRGEVDRVRAVKEKDVNLQEARSLLSRDMKRMEDRLPGLDGLRGTLLDEQAIFERYRGRDAEAEALRAELAAMRAQSEMLKKQLDELSKQKSEMSKQRERP